MQLPKLCKQQGPTTETTIHACLEFDDHLSYFISIKLEKNGASTGDP